MLLFVSNMAAHNHYSQKISIHLVEEQKKETAAKSVRQKRKEPKGKGH